MHAITTGLVTAGLLLALAAFIFALLTRKTAASEDRDYTRALSIVGQACTGLALATLAHYGYRMPAVAQNCVYAAMAAAALACVTWLPGPEKRSES